MDDLVEFLRARLGEDEQDAQAAMRRIAEGMTAPADLEARPRETLATAGRWHVKRWLFGHQAYSELGEKEIATWGAHHIARHDPARVLREVEAKRALLGMAKTAASMAAEEPENRSQATIAGIYDNTVRWLARTYADHPDYREEWRP